MGKNLLGLIFSNVNEEKIPELTEKRTMGSMPFGGKYRLIDFPLSNMSNSGMNNVAIVAKRNFLSLMDHVGSGASWDLSKRRSGLTLLPPFGNHSYNNIIESLYSIKGFLKNKPEEYVLLTSSDCVINIDYQSVFYKHLKSDADVTLIYKNMEIPDKMDKPAILTLKENNMVDSIHITPNQEGLHNLYIGMMIIKKDLLLSLVKEAMSINKTNIKRILQRCLDKYKVAAHEHKDFCAIISSVNEYFDINMSLVNKDIRHELFKPEDPIYTKVRDDTPSKYGLGSNVTNSLVSQGCLIEGDVQNSILSKGVVIGKGAKVSNCIIMEDTVIGDGTVLNYVIVDKDVEIQTNRSLSGYKSYPIYIAKQSIV